MEYREIVEGVRIPVLGMGTWGVGGRNKADRSRDGADVEALRAGIGLEMTHIDTAEYYGAGHAEELVGEAIESYDRGDLFITTKVWPSHLRHDDLIDSMRASLRRLGQDYVDLYLIHWPNPEVPLEETMLALESCAEEGYTRLIGVSNFPPSLVEEAQSHLREHRLVADQVEYSLVEQDPRSELLPYCRRKDLTLIAYTPLAKGRLARPGNDVLDELAEKYGKSHAQVSLNWLLGQERVVAIPKASNPRHLRDNVGAVGWRLSKEDSERLAGAFA
ncbi:MAG: aldo/keto reductase [Candidatus Bathyarchaeota archaeon]|nr:aldo/keto reductase [Candidatus Bathyarchaeota archaeon]